MAWYDVFKDNIGSALGLAGTIFGATSQSSGQRDVNRANIDLAQTQMAFQERMSNSAHQREVEDLRLAGLNPILSAKYGGASSPPGASATMVNPNSNRLEGSVNAARMISELKLTKASIAKVAAEASVAQSSAKIAAQDADILVSPFGRIMKYIKEISSVGGNVLPYMLGRYLVPFKGAGVSGSRRVSAVNDASGYKLLKGEVPK